MWQLFGQNTAYFAVVIEGYLKQKMQGMRT